jgi:hypothetical protein
MNDIVRRDTYRHLVEVDRIENRQADIDSRIADMEALVSKGGGWQVANEFDPDELQRVIVDTMEVMFDKSIVTWERRQLTLDAVTNGVHKLMATAAEAEYRRLYESHEAAE